MSYEKDVKSDGEALDITPLDDETPTAMEHLDPEQEKDEVLNAPKGMGLDFKRCKNEGNETSLAATQGANQVLLSAITKDAIGQNKGQKYPSMLGGLAWACRRKTVTHQPLSIGHVLRSQGGHEAGQKQADRKRRKSGEANQRIIGNPGTSKTR